MPSRPVYATFDDLPSAARPAQVTRAFGATLFTVDIRTTLAVFMAWAVDTWTDEEQLVMRAAYGQPATGPLSDWIVSDDLCVLYIPPLLRLPDTPPLQAPRAEIQRRHRERLLEREWEALAEERFGGCPARYLRHLSDVQPA